MGVKLSRKVLVVRNHQRVSAFHIDNPDVLVNTKEWVVVATDNPYSGQKLRGTTLTTDDVKYYSDWYEGKYAVDVEDTIRQRMR